MSSIAFSFIHIITQSILLQNGNLLYSSSLKLFSYSNLFFNNLTAWGLYDKFAQKILLHFDNIIISFSVISSHSRFLLVLSFTLTANVKVTKIRRLLTISNSIYKYDIVSNIIIINL